MPTNEKDNVILFESEFNGLDNGIRSTESAANKAEDGILSTSDELQEIFYSLGEIPGVLRIVETQQDTVAVEDFDKSICEIIEPQFRNSIKLTATDMK